MGEYINWNAGHAHTYRRGISRLRTRNRAVEFSKRHRIPKRRPFFRHATRAWSAYRLLLSAVAFPECIRRRWNDRARRIVQACNNSYWVKLRTGASRGDRHRNYCVLQQRELARAMFSPSSTACTRARHKSLDLFIPVTRVRYRTRRTFPIGTNARRKVDEKSGQRLQNTSREKRRRWNITIRITLRRSMLHSIPGKYKSANYLINHRVRINHSYVN